MTAPTKDEAIRAVVAELDGLLTGLQANVDALTAILTPPARPAPPAATGTGQEVPA